MQDLIYEHTLYVMKAILLVGAVMTAIGLGLKRMYSVARSVEKILEFTVSEKAAREALASQLQTHIDLVDKQHRARELQILELVDTVREISRETRPNGGSSMKDVLNHTAERVSDIHTRVAVLEEWKRNEEKV